MSFYDCLASLTKDTGDLISAQLQDTVYEACLLQQQDPSDDLINFAYKLHFRTTLAQHVINVLKKRSEELWDMVSDQKLHESAFNPIMNCIRLISCACLRNQETASNVHTFIVAQFPHPSPSPPPRSQNPQDNDDISLHPEYDGMDRYDLSDYFADSSSGATSVVDSSSDGVSEDSSPLSSKLCP